MAPCFNGRFPIGSWLQPKWTHVSVRRYHYTVKTFANIRCYILIFPLRSSVLRPQPTLNTLPTRRHYTQTAFRNIFEFKIICHPHFLSKSLYLLSWQIHIEWQSKHNYIYVIYKVLVYVPKMFVHTLTPCISHKYSCVLTAILYEFVNSILRYTKGMALLKPLSTLKHKYYNTHSYIIAACFVWTWNLVDITPGRTQVEGIQDKGVGDIMTWGRK